MKLKLLLVFTMCTMVSMAQSNSGSGIIANPNESTATNNNFTATIQNENNNFDNNIKIYPTVTEDLVNYGIKDEKSFIFTITVYDIYGKKQNVEIHKGTINLSELKSGMYIIQFSCKKYTVTKNVVRK